MTTNTSVPEQPSAVNSHSLLHMARWALALTWSTDARLTAGLIGATLVPSLTPAALALAARGLVNALVEVLTSGAGDIGLLLPWLALGLALTLVEAASKVAGTYFNQRLYDELNIRVTSDVLVHAAGLDVAFFEDPRCQDMMERAQRNIARYFGQFVTGCLNVGANGIQIVSLLGVLIAIEPLLTLLLVPLALPYLAAQWRLAQRRYDKEYARATRYRWMRYFVRQVTDQRWVPEVKLLGLAPVFIDRFRALMTDFRDQDRQLYRHSFLIDLLFVGLTTTTLYAVLARVADRVLASALTVGDVAIYAGTTARLRTALQSTVTLIVGVREGMLYISTLDEFLRVEPRIAQTAGREPPASGRGAIEFRHVSFTYPGAERPVLNDVSFRVEPGETVALVGENGAGKTTLAKLLARFYDPGEGCILADDVDLRQLSPTHWHRQIGFVFQHVGQYEATAAENIAYGDWERLLQHEDRVERIARLANVHDTVAAMPQGYDTFLGRRFGEYDLSQGQWQRLAVARAFAREDASLLILDEPTSNLDARAEYELFCRFRELAAGRTTVLISHRFSTVSMADRILVLSEGRVVEQGTHQDLLAQGGYYASLYRLHEHQAGVPPAEP